jgi:hypothetical protein
MFILALSLTVTQSSRVSIEKGFYIMGPWRRAVHPRQVLRPRRGSSCIHSAIDCTSVQRRCCANGGSLVVIPRVDTVKCVSGVGAPALRNLRYGISLPRSSSRCTSGSNRCLSLLHNRPWRGRRCTRLGVMPACTGKYSDNTHAVHSALLSLVLASLN